MVATAASSRPRFRTDLVAEPIDEDGQRYIDVIDPDTGNAFRFYEVEYSIACAMDGERDLHGLADWAREELGITPSSDEIASVVATLGDLGYLDAAAAQPGAMFGDDLIQKGVVAPAREPARSTDVELGAGGLTAGWSVPTTAERAAVGGDDVELGRAGLRVTATGPALDAMDVGLGAAGAGAVIEFEAPTPPPADVGEPVSPSLRRTTSVDDDEGPTHLPQPHAVGDFDDDEVSVDLSEHLAIRPDDVKEAVRASQVMKAVDVPPELMAQLDEQEQKLAAATEAARAAARDAQAAPQRNTPVVPMEAMVEPFGARPPVELPEPVSAVSAVAVGKSKPKAANDAARAADAAARAADAAAKTPIETTQRAGTSPVLVVLLILVILAAGAFFVWKYVLDKPKPKAADDTTETGRGSGGAAGSSAGTGGSVASGAGTGSASASGTGSASASGSGASSGTGSASASGTGSASASGSGASSGTGSASGTAPTPPATAPTGTLHASATGTVELKAAQAGTVSITTPPGTKVNAGDVVVRLLAPPAIEAKIQDIDNDLLRRYPKQIKDAKAAADQARKDGNAAALKAAEDTITEREGRVRERTAERDKFAEVVSKLELKAAAAGTVKKASAKGAAVNAGDSLATIDQGGGLSATIDAGAGATYKPGDTVKVSSTKAPDQQVDCTIAGVDGSKVTVACAADSGWADGTQIQLAKP